MKRKLFLISCAVFCLGSLSYGAPELTVETMPDAANLDLGAYMTPANASETNANSEVAAEANATAAQPSAEASATEANATDAAETTADTNATAAAPAPSISPEVAEQGALLYKTCVACHGAKGEKTYTKVPPIVNLSSEERLEKLHALKDGTANDGKGYYGMGAVMRGQLRISDDQIGVLNAYIESFKN
ncbi:MULTISPECIES: c-type cytochrome [unclassified Campylobacter]|uniref:c-type cytochrome n=1 Tax=unclassified Campylobacter TaxID=2593542 RepID=UPI0022E9D6E9|nr:MULTISPECIES: c-type cytochrome [unclassified Campylobacter]MDA3043946.1 c-type cytochrome [Campylobacter sp. JMF_09 ED2]MDA3045483.1 c-type cytochrome [Campylobacter sp. JMF_07 ED4]MDA3064097.1 c-type cytochrome [Campylobacter sp. JMF_11 EL3]MDA3075704.1 c-type cytochrome [Campylobacter sp. JMF_05 ED3]